MKVLLAIDSSKTSERAVKAVLQQMNPDDTKIFLLCVLPRRSSMPGLQQAREFASTSENRLGQAGFDVQVAVAEGDPKSVVIDHASRWKADLIVVGSLERTGLGRLLSSSVADFIARHSPCSVQVVRTPEVNSKILLAMDDSEFSEAALQQLIAQRQPQGSEVRVLHLVESLPLLPDGQVWHSEAELAEARQEQYRKAETLLRRAAQGLRDAGFRVSTVIEKGNPKRAVMDLAKQWHAGLIMLGSECRKGLEQFPIGSVSEDVAVQASCSVQITRVQAFQSSERATVPGLEIPPVAGNRFHLVIGMHFSVQLILEPRFTSPSLDIAYASFMPSKGARA